MVENVIIMAGGAGKRLWPASLGSRPKQFMSIDGGSSLIRGAMDRAFALGLEGNLYIVTHEDHVEAAVAECGKLDFHLRAKVVILAEPVARNTAPALALAAARMNLDHRERQTSLVMAADHLISPIEAFSTSAEAAANEAGSGFIVPFGITPTAPATGYGYIEVGEPVGEGFEVKSFREKPDAETAAAYLSSGHYLWNAGLFTYRNDVFLSELAAWAPDVSQAFSRPKEDWFETRVENDIVIHGPSSELRRIYRDCPAISVDYAVMEKTEKIRMVKAEFEWNDVGSWDVIADLDPPSKTPVYSVESRGNFVYSDKPVALCGVEDLIVVVSHDRVMICRKGKSQLVKEAAEEDLSR